LTPELKLQFQQMIYTLHINSSMGVDEKNIEKLKKITANLDDLANKLFWEVFQKPSAKDDVLVFEKEENDVTEATAELSAKVKAHRPESK
jgi:hypothetical protein